MPIVPSTLGPDVAAPGLVPAARFGTALHLARTRRGTTLTALARLSAGRFLPDDLVAVERGERRLGDDDVVALAALYEMSRPPLAAPAALDLVLDRSSGLAAGPWSDVDHLDVSPVSVARRLVAVAVLVGVDLTTGPLGLGAYAESVGLPIGAAVGLIEDVLGDPVEIGELVDALGSRVALADVGVLVAPTSIGDLVLVGPSGVDRCDGGTTLAELAALPRLPGRVSRSGPAARS